MKYIKLGGTNLNVSRIGFGGIPIQRLKQPLAAEVVFYALEKGINFFDTARAYSVSEEYLSCLASCRKDVIIASKAPAQNSKAFEKEIDTTLKNLKTDYIDLYQAHNIRTIDQLKAALEPNGAFDALKAAKKDGRVRHIGITSHSCDLLEYALEYCPNEFETIMYPYNIVETQGTKMLAKAKSLGKGTMAMKPLGGGNITDAKLAMRFVLANPDVDIALVGMADKTEILQNTDLTFDKLSQSELDKCKEIAQMLGDDFCRRCGYCAPCPQGIDIPLVFTMHNYLNYGLGDWAKSRYNAMQKNAKDCANCKNCEPRCPYGLQIAKRMAKIKKDFNP